MSSIAKLARFTHRLAGSRRALHATAPLADAKQLQNFNPENYSLPLRPPTMDDLMEPYGSYKVAYAAEKKRANRKLVLGFLSLMTTLGICVNSGVFDSLIMPNLDNIMEETERVDKDWDREGRISVIQPGDVEE